MDTVKLKDIVGALGFTVDRDKEVNHISTDSRNITDKTIFIAIKGERVDGHNYIEQAFDKGAVAVIAEHSVDYNHENIFVCEDSVKAMQKMAQWYRTTQKFKAVAITGSVGKTTTKDMISAVLASQFNVGKTQGNQNNEIGTSNTVFSFDKSTEVAVVEMGMCGFGEIKELAEIVKPNIGVITNIGVCHLEYLKTRENILKAKMELANELPDGSPLFLCADNDLLKDVYCPHLNVIRYGIENTNCDIKGTIIEEKSGSMTLEIKYKDNTEAVTIPTNGLHMAQNALAAYGVGVILGISSKQAANAIANYEPSGMRQRFVETKSGINIVEDCYNASPDSIKAAMHTLKKSSCEGKKYAVLSDMLELGSFEKQGHIECGEVAKNSADSILLFGNNAHYYKEGAGEKAIIFESKEQLVNYLISNLQKGDLVWFKASRGMKLEEVIEKLYDKLN